MNGLSTLLRNPFYMGYVHLRTKDKLYPGVHEPIVTKQLFFKAQERLKSRVWPKRMKHRFKYSRMFKCGTCERSLVASEVKGHVYYRCATMTCPTTCVREEDLEAAMAVDIIDGERHTEHWRGWVSGKIIQIGCPLGTVNLQYSHVSGTIYPCA